MIFNKWVPGIANESASLKNKHVDTQILEYIAFQ